MPDINAWIGDAFPLSNWRAMYNNGHNIARIISDKPTIITIYRDGAQLAPQTVRLENIDNVPFERTDEGRNTYINGLRLIIIGYLNHPTIVDTNLRAGDRILTAENEEIKIMQIEPGFIDRLIAIAEVVG